MDDIDNLTDLEIEVATAARLFGLINSNRDFSAADSWGKNQFNSSFPAALCCYMASIGMDANYLRTSSGKLGIGSLGIAEVFGSEPLAKTTHFSFELAYEAYEKFASVGRALAEYVDDGKVPIVSESLLFSNDDLLIPERPLRPDGKKSQSRKSR